MVATAIFFAVHLLVVINIRREAMRPATTRTSKSRGFACVLFEVIAVVHRAIPPLCKADEGRAAVPFVPFVPRVEQMEQVEQGWLSARQA